MKHSLYRNKMGQRHKSEKPVRFYFDNKPFHGVVGDTIASALLCNGIYHLGYSQHHHRQQGGSNLLTYTGFVYISDKKNGSVLVNPHDIEISENLEVLSASKPSLWNKVSANLSLNNIFTKQNSPYQHLPYVERLDCVFQTLGQKGQSPFDIEENFEKQYHHTDIHIIGAGLTGLYAAFIALSSGMKVILSDKKNNITPHKLAHVELNNMQLALFEAVINHPNLTILYDTTILPLITKGDVIGYRVPYGVQLDKLVNFQTEIHVIRAKHHFVATGLVEAGFLYGGCDKGGIFTPEAYRHYAYEYGFSARNNIILYTNNDSAYEFLEEMELSPHHLCAIIDTRNELSPLAEKFKQQGYSIYFDSLVTHIQGKNTPEAVFFQTVGANRLITTKSIECSLIIQSSGHFLDMNLYARQATDFLDCQTKEGCADIYVKNTKLPENISVIGYGTGALTKKEILKKTYETIKNVLHKYQVSIPFPETASEQITGETSVAAAKNFYHYDKKNMEKIFFPADICLSDLRDFYVKNGEINDVINFFFDKALLRQDSVSLNYLVSLIGAEYNYAIDKQYKTFFETYEKLYKESDYCKLQDELLNTSVITRLYPSAYHFYRKAKIPLTSQKRFAVPVLCAGGEDYSRWVQRTYETIKTEFAIQDLSPLMSVYRLVGADTVLFLEKMVEISMADLPIARGRVFDVLYNQRKISFTLWHISKNNYILYALNEDRNLVKSFMKKQREKLSDLKCAFSDMSEQYSAIEILGKKAKASLAHLDLNFSEREKAEDILLSSCWVENIEILSSSQIKSNFDNFICFMPSDTISSLLGRFIPNGVRAENYLYNHNIDHILALEEGQVTKEVDVRLYPDFTTVAMVIPLSGRDKLGVTDLLFETAQDDKTIGVVADICYSPYHQKDMALVYLKGDLSEWENRTIAVGAVQSKERFNIKVLAPDHISQKETVYE